MVNGFQVFLSDEMSSHDFLKNKFNVDGPSLETPIGKNGFNLYKIKMSEEKHLGIVLELFIINVFKNIILLWQVKVSCQVLV